MLERELPRVQRDAATADAHRGVLPARVLPLADQREAGVRAVQADLVVAAGHELYLELRRARERAQRAVARRRGLAERGDAREAAFLEDRVLPRPVGRLHAPLRERPVELLQRARAEQLLDPLTRVLVAREEHGAADVAVEPMHGEDRETLLGERFRQRAPFRARRDDAQESRGLARDEQVLVLVQDRDRCAHAAIVRRIGRVIRYEGTLYRPPSEADSLILQATIGCSYNRCTFCAMYRAKRFRVRKLDELAAEIDWAARHAPTVRKVFLADGDALIAKSSFLLEVLARLRAAFPDLQRVSCYASPQALQVRTVDEMR